VGQTSLLGSISLLRERRLELIIVVTVVVLDQVTKVLVRDALALHDSIDVVPNLLSLTRVHNTGAAFGMLNGVDFAFKTVVMSLVATAALAGVGWYALSVPLSDILARAGIAGVVGGAIGNLIDRATQGYVLDFVDAYWNGWHFWAFNVADAAITVGVACMILDILGVGRRASNPL
jgi:signal peptidase II